ncbi:MAG: phosphatidate cytidylyltransferase [Lachnospiraceae bacterium]|nr:phosphatidate cytidylyltransferase [Lachnospiraceae bacterium]
MFWTRLGSGIVLLIAMISCILLNGWVLALALCIISCIGFMELCKACKVHGEGQKINAPEVLLLFAILAFYIAIYMNTTMTSAIPVIMLAFIALMFLYVLGYPKYHAMQIMPAFFAFIYAPVMFSFIYLTRNLQHGQYLVWMIVISAWGCDTFAYCVGMLIGKHKMAPKLSPKKSVEGAIGGVAGAALLGALYGVFLTERMDMDRNLVWTLALIAAVGAVIAMVGDLAASAIKRNFEIKDYGKLIPGHGGIMDRFDSILFTAPMTYLLTVAMFYL